MGNIDFFFSKIRKELGQRLESVALILTGMVRDESIVLTSDILKGQVSEKGMNIFEMLYVGFAYAGPSLQTDDPGTPKNNAITDNPKICTNNRFSLLIQKNVHGRTI